MQFYPATIVIEIEPADRRDRFRARRADEGRLIVESSRQPFLDAARVLIQQGYDPNARLVMRRTGSSRDDLFAPLDVAANLTVHHSRHGTPVFRSLASAAPGVQPAPPIAPIESAARAANLSALTSTARIKAGSSA